MCKILGLGLDLCAIDRAEQFLSSPRLMERCFTPAERAYVAGRGRMQQASLAALWAAKEAALKALGIGIALPMTQVEIAHTPQGQPYYNLSGQALQAAQGGNLLLSITHEGNTAAAVCVWQAGETK